MKEKTKREIRPKVLAVTLVLITVILDIAGYVWHAVLKQPSIMNLLYPGFWASPTLLIIAFVGSLICAYIVGYIFAFIYNWASRRWDA